MVTQNLAQEISELEAHMCFAFSDANRILILYALEDQPCSVNELASTLNLTQPTTSRHLKILRERGLVEGDRQGTTITYRVSDHRLIQALDLLRSVLRDHLTYRANLMEEIKE